MTEHPMYHRGHRELQDRFDSRRIADRLEQVPLGAHEARDCETGRVEPPGPAWKQDPRFRDQLPKH